MPATLPAAMRRLAQHGAAPDLILATFERLAAHPGTLDRLAAGGDPTPLAETVATVVGASNMLARLLVRDPVAVDVLDRLDEPVELRPTGQDAGPEAVAGRHQRAMLRIAARDLLGLDDLPTVGAALADLAGEVLQAAVDTGPRRRPDTAPGGRPPGGAHLAVIGMGKLGGSELNYTSDVDVLLVGGAGATEEDGRHLLEAARRSFRVDADLRPEGRAGPLVRTLDGYRSYWDRWVQPWERQALLKARWVAGDPDLGTAFGQAAAAEVWGHPFTAEELAHIRAMKARTETLLQRRGLRERDVKRGHGGIRDVEFSVQLLQLVHGRLDPAIRSPATLPALAELAEAGYVDADDAATMAAGYRFLRAVEHRLQLVEGEQAHAVPTERTAYQRLARVLGYADGPGASAAEQLDEELRRHRADVRAVHERLYFRPLLEAFAALPAGPAGRRARPGAGEAAAGTDGTRLEGMSAEAVAVRLDAFGFASAARTRDAVDALAHGLTRSSRLMAQMLPLVLDWLSQSPDPDLGLQQLRDLVVHHHQRAQVVSTFRESPEAARRLCLLLGTSRLLGEALVRSPEILGRLGDDEALRPVDRATAGAALAQRLRGRRAVEDQRDQLVRFRREQLLQAASRDVLAVDDVPATAAALTAEAEAVLQAAMDLVAPGLAWAAVGLGRFGGAELSYASDLDLVLVAEDEDAGGQAAEALLALLHGSGPYEAVARVDLGLRPEGGQGRLVRDLDGYRTYFDRWAQTWERQAMVRARVVAGDERVGERFMALVDELVWGRPFTAAEITDVRRMKARVERERVAPHEDPRFHLKLGPGALADVEWTVQLLQLQHRVAEPGTMAALDALQTLGLLAAVDAEHLRAAYRFCEHTRNRWYLVGVLPGGAAPGDALPTRPEALSRLARSLDTTPADLRADYRRVTRRARAVVERVFYDMPARR